LPSTPQLKQTLLYSMLMPMVAMLPTSNCRFFG
jgi:hypothetical protein